MAHVVTLTYGVSDKYYGVEHEHAHRLVYGDVQLYVKRLRHYCRGLRFFAAGEYGAKKGRAHWHLIAFWQEDPPPNLELYKRYVHKSPHGGEIWNEGWSWWEPADDAAIAYVAKYVTKSEDEGTVEKRFGISKRPPMGARYFTDVLAPKYVEHQVPVDRYWRYRFSDVLDHNGKRREFTLRGASRRLFLDRYVELWRAAHNNDNWPQSDVVDMHVDDMLRRERRKRGEPDELADVLERRMELEKCQSDRDPEESPQLYLRPGPYARSSRGE